MFELIKKMFIGLLTSVVSVSNHTKYTSLTNQKCMAQPTFINLHPDEYSRNIYHANVNVSLMVENVT